MKALPWPVGRYRRILTALTTNQNAGFVTVPSEKKISLFYPNHSVIMTICLWPEGVHITRVPLYWSLSVMETGVAL